MTAGDMKVMVTLNVVGDIGFDEAIAVIDRAGVQLFDDYIAHCEAGNASQLWVFDIEDCPAIAKAKRFLVREVPYNAYVQESIMPPCVLFEEAGQNWFLLSRFADDASNAEVGDHRTSRIVCSACGNTYQDPGYVPVIDPVPLRAKPILMTFYAPLKMFCRPKFIPRYERSGLTGLSFSDWGQHDRHGQPLTRVTVQRHQWQERTGVCDECQMKTNVTSSWGLFSMKEVFKYDIQYLCSYKDECFVLSRRALKFFGEVTSFTKSLLSDPDGLVPVLPGYREDVVWPEPKLFGHGDIPVHMLRSSWEKLLCGKH
jgi:hypothetical protein